MNNIFSTSESTALLLKPVKNEWNDTQKLSSLSKRSESDDTTTEDTQIRLLLESRFLSFTANHTLLHPKTIPPICPERRGKRHRHPAIRNLNEFRHWWKTSRFLVRLAGSYQWCYDKSNWIAMALLDISSSSSAKFSRKQQKFAMRQAIRSVKSIGRGGPIRNFLENVHAFTRTLRLVLAVFRALEARVDNRLLEVGVAETMAFMGNRSFRYWARSLADATAKYVALPLSGRFIAPYLEQKSRPIIVTMGLFRAILPFLSSFEGSAFGRNLTFNTFSAYNYRWKPIQGIFCLHESRGVYQDIDPDPFLFCMAQQVATAIGHGHDAVLVRKQLMDIGFDNIFGAGSGGYSVYRHCSASVTLHITPYGPSVLDELPRFIVLELRPTSSPTTKNAINTAAMSPVAMIMGFTYSGAFFTSQEWASLQQRFEDEMTSYRNACLIMGTNRAHVKSTSIAHNEHVFPPTDLTSLKAFIRSGQTARRQRKSDKQWFQVQREVKSLAKIIQRHKKNGTAPKGVILYMEGLDCSGKSSTGGLIQDALQHTGYQVHIRQYNRPPTEEQKRMDWMNRFERPYVLENDQYEAIVWDRGPVGDFVYGSLHSLSNEEKLHRYAEFRKFDRGCRLNDILFLKLLFVTDKDSIAATLGKRLAHKKIAQDLRTWIDATSQKGHSTHEGLSAIESHIDPTDFIAFNKYKDNLGKFCDVARNTDQNGYDNPWFVVCTSNRHKARLALLKAFSRQISKCSHQRINTEEFHNDDINMDDENVDTESPLIPTGTVEAREAGVNLRAILQTIVLLCLAFAYAHQTWDIGHIDFD
jgi:polyphosphate kinase 2 (PPK2 family)